MKRQILFLLIITLLLLTCCKKENIMNDYPNINDKHHVFKEIKVDDVLEKLEKKESFLLVMGFPLCPWCQALMPVLNEVAKENNYKTIYYLYLKDIRDDENATGHNEYLKLQNEYFKDALDDLERINAPTFVKIENGILTRYHLNTVSSHVLNDNKVLPPLTNEQKEQLKAILNSFFN